jgi:hypothetical protein
MASRDSSFFEGEHLMNRFLTMAALTLAVLGLVVASASAQVVYTSPPAVTYAVPAPTTVYYSVPAYTYYAPAPVLPSYTTYYAPAAVVPSYSYATTTVVTPRRVRVRYYGPYYATPAYSTYYYRYYR